MYNIGFDGKTIRTSFLDTLDCSRGIITEQNVATTSSNDTCTLESCKYSTGLNSTWRPPVLQMITTFFCCNKLAICCVSGITDSRVGFLPCRSLSKNTLKINTTVIGKCMTDNPLLEDLLSKFGQWSSSNSSCGINTTKTSALYVPISRLRSFSKFLVVVQKVCGSCTYPRGRIKLGVDIFLDRRIGPAVCLGVV